MTRKDPVRDGTMVLHRHTRQSSFVYLETQVFCGKLAIMSIDADRRRRAWKMMLHTSLLQPTKDDDAVYDMRIEGAVDPVYVAN